MTGSLSRPPRQDSRIFIPIEICNGIAVLVRRQKHVLKYQNISGSPAAGLFYLHQMEKAVFDQLNTAMLSSPRLDTYRKRPSSEHLMAAQELLSFGEPQGGNPLQYLASLFLIYSPQTPLNSIHRPYILCAFRLKHDMPGAGSLWQHNIPPGLWLRGMV